MIKMIKGTYVPFRDVRKRRHNFISPLSFSNKSHIETNFGTYPDFDLATFGLTVGTMQQNIVFVVSKKTYC
jgi:hypothetical protein